MTAALGHSDQQRLEEYLTSVRSLERSVASLPPEYSQVVEQPTGLLITLTRKEP